MDQETLDALKAAANHCRAYGMLKSEEVIQAIISKSGPVPKESVDDDETGPPNPHKKRK